MKEKSSLQEATNNDNEKLYMTRQLKSKWCNSPLIHLNVNQNDAYIYVFQFSVRFISNPPVT